MKKIVKNILHFWYIYLLVIASVSIGVIYYCDFIDMPRKEETISLFISSYTNDSNKLHSFLKEKSPDYLREINITFVNPKAPEFEYLMVNKGLNKADMFILTESYIFDSLIEKQFSPLNKEVVESYFTYESDESGKGILVHKPGDQDNDLYTFNSETYKDERFYLFYRVNSLHIKGLNDAKVDTALRFTKELLNYA